MGYSAIGWVLIERGRCCISGARDNDAAKGKGDGSRRLGLRGEKGRVKVEILDEDGRGGGRGGGDIGRAFLEPVSSCLLSEQTTETRGALGGRTVD